MSLGQLTEARQALERVVPERRRNYHVRVMWGLLHALERRPDEARAEVDRNVERFFDTMIQYRLVLPEFHTALGDTPTALDSLERVTRAGDDRIEFIQRNPLFAGLRQEPRFQQIMESARLRRGRSQ
jgi:hypothetical protein